VIVMGAPVTYIRDGRFHKATHLVSTKPGQSGRVELLEFGRRIGLLPRWLRRIGSEFEHFGLFGNRIERAALAGARKIERRELMDIVWAKREARTGARRRRAYRVAQKRLAR
jgi:hypothetical protein